MALSNRGSLTIPFPTSSMTGALVLEDLEDYTCQSRAT